MMGRMPLSRFDQRAQVAPLILFFIIFALIGFLWITLGPMMDVGASTYNSLEGTGVVHSEESRQVTSTLEAAFQYYPLIALLLLVISLFITAMRDKYSQV